MAILWVSSWNTIFYSNLFQHAVYQFEDKKTRKKEAFFKKSVIYMMFEGLIVHLLIPLICSMVLMIIPIIKVLTILNFLIDYLKQFSDTDTQFSLLTRFQFKDCSTDTGGAQYARFPKNVKKPPTLFDYHSCGLFYFCFFVETYFVLCD